MRRNYKIIVLGGGFAGVSVLRHLSRFGKGVLSEGDVLLVDRKENFEFLPLLPDIISGRVSASGLSYSLRGLCRNTGADFLRAEVKASDVRSRKIVTSEGDFGYEKLAVCTGAETNFFGQRKIRDKCFKLYSCADAERIKGEVLRRCRAFPKVNVAVAGGGYTGIEAATNIYHLLVRAGKPFRIVLLEKAPEILSMTPAWIRRSARKELERIGLEIMTDSGLSDVDEGAAVLEDGSRIENCMCVWSAGVRSSEAVDNFGLDQEKSRIKVNSFLRPYSAGEESGNIFIAGDSAAFFSQGRSKPLRLAVMFAMGQGRTAAANLVNSLKAKRMRPYKAADLGYLVPFATGKAPGLVMGVPVAGPAGYALHYAVSIYRAPFTCKIDIIRDWCGYLFKKKHAEQGGDNV
ncbi:MAG: hypothetical protein GF408_06190 [Candidatus Omnitrophica bacterium]|nr:hypothetical protein [Candidatus Omnitrophota bacterium]